MAGDAPLLLHQDLALGEGDMSWRLEDHAPDLAAALARAAPQPLPLASLERGLPFQRQAGFGNFGAWTRPPAHHRAFYLRLGPGQRHGCLAFKGTEPLGDNLATLARDCAAQRSVLSWSLGNPAHPALQLDQALLSRLERFPVLEGRPPFALAVSEALEDATAALGLQQAYLARYGELGPYPVPLRVVRWPEARRQHYLAQVLPQLPARLRPLVTGLTAAGLAAYVYYYPTVPLRAAHLGLGTAGVDVTYAERWAALERTCDPAAVVAGWLRAVARALTVGFVGNDPASAVRGYCIEPQNLVLDGGMVDVASMRAMSSFAGPAELGFTVGRMVHLLAASIACFMVGPAAAGGGFVERHPESVEPVWRGLRQELAVEPGALAALPEAVRQLFTGNDAFADLHGRYSAFFGG